MMQDMVQKQKLELSMLVFTYTNSKKRQNASIIFRSTIDYFNREYLLLIYKALDRYSRSFLQFPQ